MTAATPPAPPKKDYGRAGRNLPVSIASGVALLGAVALSLAFWKTAFMLIVVVALVVAVWELRRGLLAHDIDLPEPQLVVGRGPIDGRITALNDQHAFLRTDGEAPAVGEVVRLGLSHPCTALDKWRVLVLVDDPDAADPLVVGAVATCF